MIDTCLLVKISRAADVVAVNVTMCSIGSTVSISVNNLIGRTRALDIICIRQGPHFVGMSTIAHRHFHVRTERLSIILRNELATRARTNAYICVRGACIRACDARAAPVPARNCKSRCASAVASDSLEGQLWPTAICNFLSAPSGTARAHTLYLHLSERRER